MDRPDDVSPEVWALIGPLMKLDLLSADRVVDEARRLQTLKCYSGAGDDQMSARVRPPALAQDLASVVAGDALADALRFLERLRTVVWCLHFRTDPASNYGRLYEATRAAQAPPPGPHRVN